MQEGREREEASPIGIPVPSRLTPREITACERFSLHVWGVTLFDYEPSHNGRHGYGCADCLEALRARDAEVERVRQVRQPWELAA
jgi:hypothetical protein